MTAAIIDGQGGRIGKAITEALKKAGLPLEIIAIGTNSTATQAMLKAGADRCATGENPVVVAAQSVDVIIGPMGIVAANSLLGEITPKMALAVSESRAVKVLIPINKCGIRVAGAVEKALGDYIADAVDIVRDICARG